MRTYILACGTAVALGALVAVGCGRYLPPIPPEDLAPSAVMELVVTPKERSVDFAWIASDTDVRGKELKLSEGFAIERKEIVNRGDETDPAVEFERIGYREDTHVAEREKLRAEARAAGKVGRTVRAPKESMAFKFTDTTPVIGETYVYQILPLNQNGVKGQVAEQIKMVFQGTRSTVVRQLPGATGLLPEMMGTPGAIAPGQAPAAPQAGER
jgi:hypothetical protein